MALINETAFSIQQSHIIWLLLDVEKLQVNRRSRIMIAFQNKIKQDQVFVVLPDQGSQAERGNPQDGLSQDQIPPIPLQSS